MFPVIQKELIMNNVIDASNLFQRKVPEKIDMSKNLVNNKAFVLYCDCIGQITKDILQASPYYDGSIDDGLFDFSSDDIIDVSMNESVTVAAQKLADELIKECQNSKIKIYIDSIVFRKIITGDPERVSVNMRIGSKNYL